MPIPANATAEEYGISSSLANYTIESENITTTPQREQVPDQKNAVVKEIRYDTRYDLRLTVRGETEPAATTINYGTTGSGSSAAPITWIVDTVEKAGTYNGLRRFNITAHRYANCSTETALT